MLVEVEMEALLAQVALVLLIPEVAAAGLTQALLVAQAVPA